MNSFGKLEVIDSTVLQATIGNIVNVIYPRGRHPV